MANPMQCAICGQRSTLTCGGCRNVAYCCKAHQKDDWTKGHKARCKCYKIVSNETLGRHLIATRDIQAGERIFIEPPLVYGPKMASAPICLGCHQLLAAPKPPAKNYYKCSKCAWPLCSSACETTETHRHECELMVSRHYRARIDFEPCTDSQRLEAAYCVIMPLRCMLMRQHDAAGYQRLMELQDHLDIRIRTPLYNVLRANLVTFIQTILGMSDWDAMSILRIAGILDTNAFDLRTGSTKLRSIYPTAAMISHDCVPNARHTFDSNKQIIFFAKVKIHKGDIISTSYTQPLKSTQMRRAHLWQAKCFECTCRRCSDSTELDTFAGSIFCCQCKIGKLISTDSLNKNAPWRCQLCPHELKANNVDTGNESIQNDIAKLDKSTPLALEDFLLRYRDLLHPTNTHILQVKYALTQLYGRVTGYTLLEMDTVGLKRKLELCQELLEVANRLDAGLSIFRGLLLHDLHETIVAYVKHCQNETELLTEIDVKENLATADAYLCELQDIMKVDPELRNVLSQRCISFGALESAV